MDRKSDSVLKARQHGAALLILMLLFFLAATSLILGQSGSYGARTKFDKTTSAALAQAKEALIGRAATDNNHPGSLTCPDINDDGQADVSFGNCTLYIGRFPWKTLNLPELLDGNGDRLWYALSPGLRDNPAAEPINPQKPLELTLDGIPNIAAIIFSPGTPLANQSGRRSNAVTDYLDGSNNDGNFDYISGPLSATFNDKVLTITRDDIFRTVNQRVLAEIRGPDDNPPGSPNWGLRRYYANNATFPWADSGIDGNGDPGTTTGKLPYNDFSINPASLVNWLNPNAWLPLVTYQRLSANSARISIGSSQMDVIPCPSSPCP
ncbi:hypothetical protein [Propionivibrio sp.]|uniref:hypothetical protein n=1 Tax=Propionivibrio sp. TaxID=2212460 RepID=UPI002602BE79|nr:hypothetical protein [Propionivibrio sp.]